jgi:hypothetical protein
MDLVGSLSAPNSYHLSNIYTFIEFTTSGASRPGVTRISWGSGLNTFH